MPAMLPAVLSYFVISFVPGIFQKYHKICYDHLLHNPGPHTVYHRLRVFENRVLRRIFGPKRDEVTGEWRKLHSGEFHNLCSSPDITRQIKSRRMR
jgi:hypothetical protein